MIASKMARVEALEILVGGQDTRSFDWLSACSGCAYRSTEVDQPQSQDALTITHFSSW